MKKYKRKALIKFEDSILDAIDALYDDTGISAHIFIECRPVSFMNMYGKIKKYEKYKIQITADLK